MKDKSTTEGKAPQEASPDGGAELVEAELVDANVTDALGDDLELDGQEEASDGPVLTAAGTAIAARTGSRLPENLTALNVYLARLKDVEILPVEEQAELAIKFQADGDAEAAARLVASNLRLVVKIAFQFRRQWADVMDLIAEGNVGLAEAIRKFDAEKGVPFPSYARFWIRARILAFIQENKHMIHAGSRAARKLFWRLERERRKLIQEGHDPTPKRLAERVGVKPEDVIELAPIIEQRPVSLDAPVGGEGEGRSRGDLLSDDVTVSPEGAAASGQVQGLLHEAFVAFRETLDDRDQRIWDQRLQALEPVRLEDLGGQFGVSKERVRQLEVKIKERLKVYLKRQLGEDIIVEALR